MSRRSAAESVGRLLSLVPWVAAQPGGATIDEVCERFDISRSQLLSDLGALGFVGVAPQTPDTMVEVTVSGEWIDVRPQWFDRAPALTASQGLALIAAAKALLQIPGASVDGSLGRALAKVEQALGLVPGQQVALDLGIANPDVYDTLRQAVADGGLVAIRYFTHGRNQSSERTIEPWQIIATDGAWYVESWCQMAGERRVFRLDRMTSVQPAEGLATEPRRPQLRPGSQLFTGEGVDLEVTVVVDRRFAWAVEPWNPEDSTDVDDANIRVTLRVGNPAGLERLLVQLGPHITVESCSNPGAVDVAAAARRILARYR